MFRVAFRRLLAVDDSPERTALAFSTGVFIGFSPFLGLHVVIATLVAFLFRFNKIAIYLGTFVNNPLLTLVPIVFASYAIGARLLGRPLRPPRGGMRLLVEPHLLTGDYWHQLFKHSSDLLLPFAVGGMTLSVICSAVSYPVTLKLLRANRRRKELKAGRSHEAKDAGGRTKDDG